MNLGDALAKILLAELETLGEDILFRNKIFKANVGTSDQTKAMEIGGYFENQSLQIIFPKYSLIDLESRPKVNEIIQTRGSAYRIHSVRVMESEHGYDLTTELVPDYPLVDMEGGLIPNRPTEVSVERIIGRPTEVVAEELTAPNSISNLQVNRSPIKPSDIDGKLNYVDIYIVAGQSNAHGHSSIVDLSGSQADDISIGIHTSWHLNTSNATTQQYYTDYENTMVLGKTRGEGTSATLNSNFFGIEWGFAKKLEENNTTNSEIGIVKYAVGASTIDDNANLADWDIEKNTECWQGFKNAIGNFITALANQGKNPRWKGLVWYQGESNAGNQPSYYKDKLIKLIEAIEAEINITNLPSVFCAPADANGNDLNVNNAFASLARSADHYNFIKISDYHDGQNSNVHLSAQNMYSAGVAVGDAMALATDSNATEIEFKPDATKTNIWVDANDETTITADNQTFVLDKIISKSSTTIDILPFSKDSNYEPTIIHDQNEIALLDCLTLSDDREFLQTDGVVTMPSQTQDWFIVAKPTINNGQDSLWATENGRSITLIPVGGNLYKWYYNGNIVSSSQATTNQNGQLGLYCIRWNFNGQHTSTWFNGTQIDSQRTTPVSISMPNLQHQFMAQYGATPSNTTDGNFCEAIVSTATADRLKIEGYLAKKWEITLPSNHLYRYYAP